VTRPGLRPAWTRREPPLPYAAVAAPPPYAAGLATATAGRIARGAPLRASGGQGWLVVLGEPDELPWAPGVTYLGWEADVLVPTTLRVSPPAGLVRAALGTGPAELVVLVPGVALLSPRPVRPADPHRLAVG
jgi:hypothetical protein